jgi:hypothetical protein
MSVNAQGAALLVGSVPLATVEQVMTVASRELGGCARCLPDVRREGG